MSEALRIWRNQYQLLNQIRSKKEREKFALAILDYAFQGEIPELKGSSLILFECIKHNLIVQNQGGRNKRLDNGLPTDDVSKDEPLDKSLQTVSEPLSDNRKQITDSTIPPSEDKSSSVGIVSAAAPKNPDGKKYAFEGKIIRLTSEDFAAWEEAYPDLNLRAELLQRDLWLQNQPPDVRKNWFLTTSQYFIRQNERRKVQNREFDEEQEDLESWLKRSVV